jgi:hypothetical protein
MKMPTALTRALRKISSAYPMGRSHPTEAVFAPLPASLAIEAQKEPRFSRPAPPQSNLQEIRSNIDDDPLDTPRLRFTGDEPPLTKVPDGLRVNGLIGKENEASQSDLQEIRSNIDDGPLATHRLRFTGDEPPLKHVPAGLRFFFTDVGKENEASQNPEQDSARPSSTP